MTIGKIENGLEHGFVKHRLNYLLQKAEPNDQKKGLIRQGIVTEGKLCLKTFC